jgi:catechol 2,3-dioxygenase-like lactoylglutathione lyase family enzyme
MIDHVGIRVADYDRSKEFCAAVLAALGYTLAMETAAGAGFRRGHIPSFWIKQGTPTGASRGAGPHELEGRSGPAVHIAFTTEGRSTVDAFHRAALAAGGQDNGAPRLRAEYHPHYYGAFVLDPDGYNIEAVCHRAL